MFTTVLPTVEEFGTSTAAVNVITIQSMFTTVLPTVEEFGTSTAADANVTFPIPGVCKNTNLTGNLLF